MRDSLKLGSVAGIPIGLNWSLLVIAGLLTWQLTTLVFPSIVPDQSTAAYLAAGLMTATALFGSILTHELGHAAIARREGVPVEGITLWLLGGVARLGAEPRTAGAELRIAAAGPAVSVGVAATAGVAALAAGAAGAPDLAVTAIAWIAALNLILVIFNLVPAAPLDGGRILKALLWWRHGDRIRATMTATGAGIVVGWAMVGLGLVQVVAGGPSGLWTALLGWFVLSAAQAERAAALRERRIWVRPEAIDVVLSSSTVDPARVPPTPPTAPHPSPPTAAPPPTAQPR